MLGARAHLVCTLVLLTLPVRRTVHALPAFSIGGVVHPGVVCPVSSAVSPITTMGAKIDESEHCKEWTSCPYPRLCSAVLWPKSLVEPCPHTSQCWRTCTFGAGYCGTAGLAPDQLLGRGSWNCALLDIRRERRMGGATPLSKGKRPTCRSPTWGARRGAHRSCPVTDQDLAELAHCSNALHRSESGSGSDEAGTQCLNFASITSWRQGSSWQRARAALRRCLQGACSRSLREGSGCFNTPPLLSHR